MDLPNVYPLMRKVYTSKEIHDLVDVHCATETYVQDKMYEVSSDVPFLSKVSLAEISSYMQNVLLRDTDQMSMAHALEVRFPFLTISC
jgi:asparagine synthase (glutamine-hydrolysing)